MKTFLEEISKMLDRSAMKALVGLNLLATSGLGTLMAGRFWAGLAQMALACVGLLMVLWWMYYLFRGMAAGVTEIGHMELLQLGLVLFFVSWLGALWSSVGMLR